MLMRLPGLSVIKLQLTHAQNPISLHIITPQIIKLQFPHLL